MTNRKVEEQQRLNERITNPEKAERAKIALAKMNSRMSAVLPLVVSSKQKTKKKSQQMKKKQKKRKRATTTKPKITKKRTKKNNHQKETCSLDP